MALDPLSAVINNSLGDARVDVGRFDDALVAYKQAIEIEPTMPYPYSGIGLVYAYGLGRFDSAMPWFEKAASLDPGDREAPAALAHAHWELGDDTEAERWLAQMPAIGEGIAYTNVVAALLYLDRGDEAAARKHAQVAAELDPWSMFLMRDDDLRKGDYASARARYAKAFPDLFAKELPTFNELDALCSDRAGARVAAHRRGRARQGAPRSQRSLSSGPFRVWEQRATGSRTLRSTHCGETSRKPWRSCARPSRRAGERSGATHRDFDPSLASIRNEPEFKAVFADIERDMARQRARLAARPKDAPLDLAVVH